MPKEAAANHPADLSVVEASTLLHGGALSSVELVGACLERIRDRDGCHSFDGAPDAINAWIRVYEEDALAAAHCADRTLGAARRGSEDAPSQLCGIPIGLKDLFAVAGRPLTASSRACDLEPTVDSGVWSRLREAGMVLLGHLHTHEWAAGGSTDQVGNPWDRTRSAGGSSGGSAAALAAGMTPAATGTDTAGSLRIPAALCGVSSFKPTRGRVPLDGVIPLAWSLDHAGPMARSVADCGLLLEAMAPRSGPARTSLPLAGTRIALSPRLEHLPVDGEVLGSFAAVVDLLRGLGAVILEPPGPSGDMEVAELFFTVLGAEMLAYHRRHDDVRQRYRASTQELLGLGETGPLTLERYGAAQLARIETTALWERWFEQHRVAAILEPTVAFTAPQRGTGYDRFVVPDPFTTLTYLWDWAGFPVACIPSGLGDHSGLPVGLSVVAPSHQDDRALTIAAAVQAELPLLSPPV